MWAGLPISISGAPAHGTIFRWEPISKPVGTETSSSRGHSGPAAFYLRSARTETPAHGELYVGRIGQTQFEFEEHESGFAGKLSREAALDGESQVYVVATAVDP